MQTARIDLHLHLDGSLNIRWAYEKALLRKVIEPEMSFEAFYDLLYAYNKPHSAESFKKFELVCDVLQDYEDLYEATYDLGRRLAEMGIYYAEIRFASQQHTKKGLSQYDALKAVIDGAAKAMTDYDISLGIINCLMHKGDSSAFNEKENQETIIASEKLFGQGLVGLDLAGYENNCAYDEYASLFKTVKEKGIPFTLHAGEMDLGEHILDALAMQPDRIGHGIDCLQDVRYITALKQADIPLEVCVSSNVKNDLNYARHPIRKLMETGLKITINTDNMIFARTDLINEHHQLQMIGVSEDQLVKASYTALEAAFCDQKIKEKLKKKLDAEFKKAQIV